MAPARRGFTLFELLVVMGLIGLLAAISFGGLVTSRGNQGITGVSTLVGDLLRQAQHSARSSGVPVEIRVVNSKQPGQTEDRWVIQGVTQLMLLGEQFEADSWNDDGDALVDIGFAGTGRRLDELTDPIELRRRPALFGKLQDSFYVECAVRPPRILASPGTSVFALSITDDNGDIVAAIDLEPQGSSTQPLWSISGQALGEQITHSPSKPIIGGDWVRIGIMSEIGEMSILRDGERVASTPVPAPAIPPAPLSVNIGDPNSAPGTIDNIRIYRLGSDSAVALPQGITPAAAYRCVVYPDGRVEPDGRTTSDATWVFNWTRGGTQGYKTATISIQADGTISTNFN